MILLFSLYVLSFDPFVAFVGIAVAFVSLFNAYQAHKGIKPKFIRNHEEKEEEKLKEEREQNTFYNRQRQRNLEKRQEQAKKQEEREKEDKFNL